MPTRSERTARVGQIRPAGPDQLTRDRAHRQITTCRTIRGDPVRERELSAAEDDNGRRRLFQFCSGALTRALPRGWRSCVRRAPSLDRTVG
jgi:hypothetical protein